MGEEHPEARGTTCHQCAALAEELEKAHIKIAKADKVVASASKFLEPGGIYDTAMGLLCFVEERGLFFEAEAFLQARSAVNGIETGCA